MKTPASLLRSLWLLLLASGCLDIPEIGDSDDLPGAPVWVAPASSPAFTNGVLDLELQIAGVPDAVEFYRDGVLLVRKTRPPYVHPWDTSGEAEGAHEVTARVIRSGKVVEAPARAVVVDRTAPTVLGRSPAPGTPNVLARTQIAMTFSEPMDPASMLPGAAQVLDGAAALSAILSLSPDGETLTLTPIGPLPAGAFVRVAFPRGSAPTDLAGNQVQAGSEWTFEVPFWLPLGGPLSAHPGATNVRSPDMAVDSQSRPYLVWLESNGTVENVHAARWNNGDWEPLEAGLAGQSDPKQGSRPRIALSPEDEPYLASVERFDTLEDRLVLRKWAQGQWRELRRIPLHYGGAELGMPLISASGEVLVFATVLTSGGNEVRRFSFYPEYPTWGENAVVTEGESTYSPALSSVLPRGEGSYLFAYAARSSSRSPARSLRVADEGGSPLGGSASFATIVMTSALAVATDGSVYAAWLGRSAASGATPYAGVQRFEPTSHSWKTIGPDVVEPGTVLSGDDNDRPALVVTADGQAVVALSGLRNGETSVIVRRWNGTAWVPFGKALSAYPGGATVARAPSMVLDANGSLFIAWTELDSGGVQNIHTAQWNQ